eukprot:6394679-Pyramimonas_sp.AAC.1
MTFVVCGRYIVHPLDLSSLLDRQEQWRAIDAEDRVDHCPQQMRRAPDELDHGIRSTQVPTRWKQRSRDWGSA